MWNRRPGEERAFVTCIACGDHVSRERAREYDKFGNRWDRSGKHFEFLCKRCDAERCRQPRGDLEDILSDIEASTATRSAFIAAFTERVRERSESLGGRDR